MASAPPASLARTTSSAWVTQGTPRCSARSTPSWPLASTTPAAPGQDQVEAGGLRGGRQDERLAGGAGPVQLVRPDAHGAAGAARERLPQPGLGLRRPKVHDGDVRVALGGLQREPQRERSRARRVRLAHQPLRAHAAAPRVELGGMRTSAPTSRRTRILIALSPSRRGRQGHVVRKRTPNPPSG